MAGGVDDYTDPYYSDVPPPNDYTMPPGAAPDPGSVGDIPTPPQTQGDAGITNSPPGSGADNIDQGGGFNPAAIISQANSDPNFMAMLQALAKAFGMSTTGSGWMLPLLSMLAGGLGTLNLNNKTQAASQQIQAAAQASNKQATDLLGPGTGGAMANFTPFIQNGQNASNGLYGMVNNNNLAGNFQPLAGHAFTPNPGITTLAQLAKKK